MNNRIRTKNYQHCSKLRINMKSCLCKHLVVVCLVDTQGIRNATIMYNCENSNSRETRVTNITSQTSTCRKTWFNNITSQTSRFFTHLVSIRHEVTSLLSINYSVIFSFFSVGGPHDVVWLNSKWVPPPFISCNIWMTSYAYQITSFMVPISYYHYI